MLPIWLSHCATCSVEHGINLSKIARQHGGYLPWNHYYHQPYTSTFQAQQRHIPSNFKYLLLEKLQEKMNQAQDSTLSKSTRAKDLSRLQDYVFFCESLGIPAEETLPAHEDLLIAWALSYVGCLTGRTVGAKILAIKWEHQNRGLLWQGGDRLHQILKGIKEIRPLSSHYVKRAPVTIPMLTDINCTLNRPSRLDNCIRAICCLAFFSQLHIGELLPPTQDILKFDRTHHATLWT